jgi:hypothetical protein
MNPEETNYWIVRFGFPILILEFLSLFVLISLGLFDYDVYLGACLLIAIVLTALFFTIFINILAFLYFLLIILINFLAFRREKNVEENDGGEGINVLRIVALSWFFALMIGFFASPILTNFYPEQINAIENFYTNQLPPSVHVEGNVSTGSLVVLGGITYFFCSFIFTLVEIIYSWKKRKN